MTAPGLLELATLEQTSGVSATTSAGFVTLRAVATDGTTMVGQLNPDATRQLALDMIAAGDAAETDALLVELLTELDLPDHVVGGFLSDLRGRRDTDR